MHKSSNIRGMNKLPLDKRVQILNMMVEGSSMRATVVTEEKGGTAEKPHIPYVCQEEDIRYISLLELITEQT